MSNNNPVVSAVENPRSNRFGTHNNPSSASTSTTSTSSSSSYHDPSSNDLTLLSGAILLTADCMGTGILALPADVQMLGRVWGLGFLAINLPVNLYAGTILGWCAEFVEEKILGHAQGSHRSCWEVCDDSDEKNTKKNIPTEGSNEGKVHKARNKEGYSSVENADITLFSGTPTHLTIVDLRQEKDREMEDASSDQNDLMDVDWNQERESCTHHHYHADTATFDFVGMTSLLFDEPILQFMSRSSPAEQPKLAHHQNRQHHHSHRSVTYDHPFTKLVLTIYYINLFLVLGNYILVMSHAVSAMVGEDNLCIPTAGLIASTLMFGLSQLRTMSNLGRSVSTVSLLALLVVVLQCLHALRESAHVDENDVGGYDTHNASFRDYEPSSRTESNLAKMSSVAAIGFAVGSQKLFLNIRHEMADRSQAAPGSLSISLSLYGLAYVVVCILAGPRPPSFLFDAIPQGLGRRIAGLLLWIHVAVSYAINSQAFCSSVDRVIGHKVKLWGLERRHRARWTILTALVAITSYLVANAIPFFKDLVALCGALTSVPLTLLLPAIFYRRILRVPLLLPTNQTMFSFILVVFSIIFLVIGLIGSIGSIEVDWKHQEGPFACH